MPAKSAKATMKYDYSGLEAGMKLQAESDGTYYSAEVVTVSTNPKKQRAPVKVHFLGYAANYDEWVGGSRLRSKALKSETEKKPSKSIDAIDNEKDIVKFLKSACKDKKTPEYAELYRFLLNVFKTADRDFDGLVTSGDFDLMVEMAGAIPRRFAFAPTSVESFATDQERIDFRKNLFGKIDADGSGTISFDEWLTYAYKHICEKTATLDEKKDFRAFSTKDGFKAFVIKACRSKNSSEYKQLYDILLSEFVAADKDMDGKVSPAEFDKMIDLAAALPRKFGFAPPASETYKSADERIATRKKMFQEMDTDGNGTIGFEEWLDFSYKHICSKAKQLDDTLSGVPPVQKAGSGGCPFGFDKK